MAGDLTIPQAQSEVGSPVTDDRMLTSHRVQRVEVPVVEIGASGFVPTDEVAEFWQCMFCTRRWPYPAALPSGVAPCLPRPAAQQ